MLAGMRLDGLPLVVGVGCNIDATPAKSPRKLPGAKQPTPYGVRTQLRAADGLERALDQAEGSLIVVMGVGPCRDPGEYRGQLKGPAAYAVERHLCLLSSKCLQRSIRQRKKGQLFFMQAKTGRRGPRLIPSGARKSLRRMGKRARMRGLAIGEEEYANLATAMCRPRQQAAAAQGFVVWMRRDDQQAAIAEGDIGGDDRQVSYRFCK